MAKVSKPSKVRIALETAIAAFAGVLGILTIFWHDWIEGLTGWDPDHHNGTFEWLIVVVLLAIAAVVAAVARRDRRLRAAGSEAPS
jgi:undecaprenyl pyrophosphate phosphatase UppP